MLRGEEADWDYRIICNDIYRVSDTRHTEPRVKVEYVNLSMKTPGNL